ncbi:MAG TPA: hypothetical protein VLS93_11925, partial [Anaeromyxobacteraceae bacterium]|nr:hypothetical protein [Anaeromyxobacteraceae bacterium]
MPRLSQIEAIVGAIAFVAYAWFHMGGGWNQNARFAMVRAIVEEGTFSVDSFLVYAARPAAGGPDLVRAPVRDARFALDGRSYALGWRGPGGTLVPLGGAADPGPGPEVVPVEPERVACTGDLSFHAGRFHPAKAPGGSLAAVPAYFLLHALERAAGADPDAWRTLTVNAWLTSALSVGLISALGCVLFFRLAIRLSGGRAPEALGATLVFAFGTPFFPYATGLFEHDLVAVALLASFHLLAGLGAAPPGGVPAAEGARVRPLLAGASAGFAAVANYVAAAAVVLLGAYLVLAVRRRRAWIWYALGALAPLLLLGAYHAACFGSPFTTAYAHENPAFRSGASAFLGVFLAPDLAVLPAVLVSPFRGLLVGSPALLLGAFGCVRWWRRGERRAEILLALSIAAVFLLFVTTFNGWHGGWAVGPRYLVPALPFLALPAVAAFERF